jgi:NitT/TauT family transport system substrate-binding protein
MSAGPAARIIGDHAIDLPRPRDALQIYSRDGIVSEGSQKRSLDFLRQFDKEMAAATIDPNKTFDGRFVMKAAETIK